jgi:hypothetical protein
MMETFWQIAFVVGIASITLVSLFRIKSPSKGGDAMSSILAELQKPLDPQVKHATKQEREGKVEGEKADEDTVG